MTHSTSKPVGDYPPQLYVIAGPNGVGKTTFAMTFLPEVAGCLDFLNADEIARGLSPLNPDAASVKAGKILLAEMDQRIGECRSFAIETTLSGRGYAKRLALARETGYEVNLVYLWVPTVDVTISRVRERVRHGGHNIPEEMSRRRFVKSLHSLIFIYWQHVDFMAICDCSTGVPEQVYERDGDAERIMDPNTYLTIREMAEAGQ